MGKQKSRQSRVSMGGRQKANVAHEAKRQAKFSAKRENGTAYEYKPIPYNKGTVEYNREVRAREEKNKSKKLPLAVWTSFMAKLENELNKAALEAKKVASANKKAVV